jgi:hypothetical protein
MKLLVGYAFSILQDTSDKVMVLVKRRQVVVTTPFNANQGDFSGIDVL